VPSEEGLHEVLKSRDRNPRTAMFPRPIPDEVVRDPSRALMAQRRRTREQMVTYVAMADALEFMEYDQSTSAEKDEFYKNPWIRFEGIECNFFTPCNDDSREWDTNQDAAGW
jgi:hypothetical protein